MTKLSPKILFLSGLLVLPAFLFQNNLPAKASQTALFIILCAAGSRRMLILPPLIAFFSVTLMNLLSPHGEVLITIGRFPITETALHTGLHRALTLIGLIYLSKLAITRHTRLPGTLGALIAKTFFFFERMTEEWKNIKEKRLLVKLDTLMLTLEAAPAAAKKTGSSAPSSRRASIMFALIFITGNWLLLVLTLAIPHA